MNIEAAKSVLTEKRIAFGIMHGLDRFYYTALTFESIKLARQAMKALKFDHGLSSIGDQHMIKFYG